MPERVRRKWRPPLALIVVGAMAGIVAVAVFGLLWVRVAGNILSAKEVALTIQRGRIVHSRLPLVSPRDEC